MIAIQLSPLIPLDTPRGRGMAHLMIDPGFEHHLQFVVFLDASGECWAFEACQIRLQPNTTAQRDTNTKDEIVVKLTTKARSKIPASNFAGPGRSYPVEDKAHARNAKARAAQFASPALKARIDAKADKVLGKGKKK